MAPIVYAAPKRGKEVTPRHRAVIIAYHCLSQPMSFCQIEEATGVSKSTASDIWRHAIGNAHRANVSRALGIYHAENMQSAARTAPPVGEPGVASSLIVFPAPRPFIPLVPDAFTASTSTTRGLESVNGDFSLLELIDSKVLDPTPRSGCPEALNEADKDRLVSFVKRGFETRRMTL
ncbi:hypothetical protein L873DRAFT_1796178 [Choiromyces venosus 120613-1]|uniref:Uncharacterized protein n=1 Tax=Choiromyces venosus 120613-1 TaxID=1336337 RepID=A0A3N4IU56_9PEZI|nr:hypothetical protein L873DRAFT_1796178 [Choiromyces venosus 120613-1]